MVYGYLFTIRYSLLTIDDPPFNQFSKKFANYKKPSFLCTPFKSQKNSFDFLFAVLLNTHGHGAMVAYGSPTPLMWVRILLPVLIFFNAKIDFIF